MSVGMYAVEEDWTDRVKEVGVPCVCTALQKQEKCAMYQRRPYFQVLFLRLPAHSALHTCSRTGLLKRPHTVIHTVLIHCLIALLQGSAPHYISHVYLHTRDTTSSSRRVDHDLKARGSTCDHALRGRRHPLLRHHHPSLKVRWELWW